MSPIGDTIRHEIRELLPAVIYFVITFNLIGFTKVLTLREHGQRGQAACPSCAAMCPRAPEEEEP